MYKNVIRQTGVNYRARFITSRRFAAFRKDRCKYRRGKRQYCNRLRDDFANSIPLLCFSLHHLIRGNQRSNYVILAAASQQIEILVQLCRTHIEIIAGRKSSVDKYTAQLYTMPVRE